MQAQREQPNELEIMTSHKEEPGMYECKLQGSKKDSLPDTSSECADQLKTWNKSVMDVSEESCKKLE